MASARRGRCRHQVVVVRVLLAVTGGVAAYKAIEVLRRLREQNAEVHVIMTRDAGRFVGAASFAALSGRRVADSLWSEPEHVEHIALARWGDVLVVAPATAHTLARLAGGFADDMLGATALAFTGPVVLAPAMHAEMWEHPATRRNVALLTERGACFVGPEWGALTSGDVGVGRLAEPESIATEVVQAAALRNRRRGVTSESRDARPDGPAPDGLAPDGLGGEADSLVGCRVLVTLGGTREPLDAVRYLGNRSSGRMGAALVRAAARRGADVFVVAAPADVSLPEGVEVVAVTTAAQLAAAVFDRAPSCDVVLMAAAVADFRPNNPAEGKLKKSNGTPRVELEPTVDVAAAVGGSRSAGQVLVGFAAETEDHVANGQRKLISKQLDLVLVNHVESTGSAFGADHAQAYLVEEADVRALGDASKSAIAEQVMIRVVQLLQARRVVAAHVER